MRSALLTTAGIFVLAAGCGESGEKKSGEEGREAVSATTSAEGSASPAKPARRALVFREPTLAGPAYVAASDQLLIIDTDGSVDVVSESLGIAQLEQLPTGELLLRSANGLDRVSGRAIKPITTSVPAAATEFSAAADDDVWAVGKRSVHHFDGKDWRITAVPGSQAEPHFRGVAVDATGVAWLAAGTDGLFAWDGSRWKKEEAVKGEVLHVAASAAGVHVVQPTGVVELKGGAVTDVVRRSGADVKAGDVAGDRSWMLFLGDAGGAISFSVGKGETQSWDGPLLRFTTESRWFTPDTRGRVWVTTKRNVIVAGKD
ncbi:MAG: hypothetical protein JNK04_24105, partial [Myxococcales bacterium]|nr:hypothetical protein [Myxococcales bacterium]